MVEPVQDSSANVLSLLTSIGIADHLDSSDITALRDEIEVVTLPGGQVLFRQGDVGDSLCLLLSGRLRTVLEDDTGTEHVLGEIGRGECIGEMAVLMGETRSATVRAIRDSELVRFSKEAFDRIVAKNPQAMMLIAKRLVKRLREMSRPPSDTSLVTIAVVAAEETVPLTDFVQHLASSLAEFGATRQLTSRLVEEQFGRGAASSSDQSKDIQVSGWLNDQEANFDYLIYEADLLPSPWTERCVRQADRILLVGRGESKVVIDTKIALAINRSGARKELVLLHTSRNQLPEGTSKWLAAEPVDRHHHICLNSQGDYDRLARILTGRAVGLTLGGGGARGLAHIGVIRALEEARIPIDMIGGTSMGAVIAAQYALGYDYKAMIEINKKGWIRMDPMKDKTLPLVALLAGRKMDKMLDMMFGATNVEDLWIKFFCISANLTLATPTVQASGPLWRAVRASMSIPGVAPPLIDNGNLIVDGGVLNNLPGDVMRQLLGGKVIAVDVSPQKDLAVDVKYQQTPTAWSLLWNRINPLSKPFHIPGVLDIMMRTMMLTSVYNSKIAREHADLYLRPPVDEFGIFEWKSLEAIVDAGYRHAQKELEAWKPVEAPVTA